jgi:predicted kinase
MTILTITQGLPASGKSTWALEQTKKDGTIVRVNKDTIRLMLGAKWNPKHEKLVHALRNVSIETALYAGKNVINDDTNLPEKAVNELRDIAKSCGAEFVINDSFLSVDVETCIARDAARAQGVGKDVIVRFYHRTDAPAPAIIPDAPEAIICDLDGTLCLFDGNPYDRDFMKDTPNAAVSWVLDSAHRRGCEVIFLSGRDERFREVTEKWLLTFGFGNFGPLFMRAEGDKRGDQYTKHDLFVAHVQGKYNVRFVLDDRPKVVRRWRHDFGLTCFQVAPDIEF